MDQGIADPGKCGAGQGANCCIFLTMQSHTGVWICARATSMEPYIVAHRPFMNAQRMPTEVYPACQLQGAN